MTMKKNDFSVSDEKPKLPEWYWHRGLHDAKIVRIEKLELPYDYKQRIPTRNCFVVHIDSKQSMFDTSVREIRLFNYKIFIDIIFYLYINNYFSFETKHKF